MEHTHGLSSSVVLHASVERTALWWESLQRIVDRLENDRVFHNCLDGRARRELEVAVEGLKQSLPFPRLVSSGQSLPQRRTTLKRMTDALDHAASELKSSLSCVRYVDETAEILLLSSDLLLLVAELHRLDLHAAKVCEQGTPSI